MYYLYTITDSVSVPPKHMSEDAEGATTDILRSRYERTLDKDIGIILVVFNVRNISDGYILPADPNIHHDVTFDVLAFGLDVEEVVVGEVSELADFGLFVRLGPIDGLVHLSQITSDFITYDRKAGVFVSKNTKRTIKKGDTVYAKVSTVSMRNSIQDIKIALTMRADGFGKPEWIKEDKLKGIKEKRRKK
ncbi:DNA-directed RNA polymerase subunit E' [uncultured archaeon]|nr:DNA-directed RNA polymerase subunit E' [uncultured archaeon]